MGYFVESKGSMFLPKENLNEAYVRMCALNANDKIKRGGRFPRPEELVRSESSKSLGHPDTWFSWMPWDYDVKFSTAKEIIEELGFQVDETEEGLEIYGYADKTGQEDIFFQAIGDLLQPDREILWIGEDFDNWRWRTYEGRIDTN